MTERPAPTSWIEVYARKRSELKGRVPDVADWDDEDLLSLGCAASDIDIYLADPNRIPNEDQLAAVAKYKNHPPTDLGTLETEFPTAFADFKDRLPHAERETTRLYNRLERFFTAAEKDDADNGADPVRLYWCLFAELKKKELRMFHPEFFDRMFEHALNKLSKAAEAAARGNRGRPATERSRLRDQVMKALSCRQNRAYQILDNGSVFIEQRKLLAAAFSYDRERNRPAHWESEDGQRALGREAKNPFREFVLARVDALDDRPAISALWQAYIDGVLPDHFNKPGQLRAALNAEGVNVDADSILDLWAEFERWRVLSSLV